MTKGQCPPTRPSIEITYTDDGTSFVGDREIIEGTVTVTFSNETDSAAVVAFFGYDTGSAALAEEMEFLAEGDRACRLGHPPRASKSTSKARMSLRPGATPGRDLDPAPTCSMWVPRTSTAGLWRAAVIDVVAT